MQGESSNRANSNSSPALDVEVNEAEVSVWSRRVVKSPISCPGKACCPGSQSSLFVPGGLAQAVLWCQRRCLCLLSIAGSLDLSTVDRAGLALVPQAWAVWKVT